MPDISNTFICDGVRIILSTILSRDFLTPQLSVDKPVTDMFFTKLNLLCRPVTYCKKTYVPVRNTPVET